MTKISPAQIGGSGPKYSNFQLLPARVSSQLIAEINSQLKLQPSGSLITNITISKCQLSNMALEQVSQTVKDHFLAVGWKDVTIMPINSNSFQVKLFMM